MTLQWINQWRNVFVVTIAGVEMTDVHYCTTVYPALSLGIVKVLVWFDLLWIVPSFILNSCTVMQTDTQSISNYFIGCLVSHIDVQSCMDPWSSRIRVYQKIKNLEQFWNMFWPYFWWMSYQVINIIVKFQILNCIFTRSTSPNKYKLPTIMKLSICN